MNLYEILTGAVGESYERAYAWAASEDDAIQLFNQRRLAALPAPDDANVDLRGLAHVRAPNLRVRLLFEEADAPFCTESTDHGWP